MSSRAWRFVVALGTLVALVAMTLGHVALLCVFQAACVMTFISMILGVRKFSPRNREVWFGFAATAALFFVAYGLRIGFLSMLPRESGAPTLADYVDGLAFLSAIITLHRFGQVRDRDKDPTTIIDSWILTGGVSTVIWISTMLPYIQDETLATSGRFFGVVLAALAVWLVLAAVRLAIGPGVKSLSSRLLAISGLFGMAAQISAGESAEGSVANIVLFAGSLSLIFLAGSVLHPSMVNMTEISSRGISQMTKARLTSMTLALLIAPVMLVFEIVSGESRLLVYGGLIFFWMIVTVLVMIRFAGLVRAREREANIEHTLSRLAALLVSSTDSDSTYQHALTAIAELAGSECGEVSASVALMTENEWRIICSRGSIDHVSALEILQIDELVVESGRETFQLDSDNVGELLGRSTVVAPLVSHGQIRGALLVTTKDQLSSIIVDAIGSLASDVSLAVEAVGLAEDLHRERNERRFRSLVQHSSDITAVLDNLGRINYLSPSIKTLLGYSPDSLLGHDLSQVIHRDDEHVLTELASFLLVENSAAKVLEVRAKTADNNWKFLEATLTDLRNDPEVEGIVMNAHDITDRKTLEQDLRHKVLHDDLTGIPNRVLFKDRVDHAVKTLRHHKGTVTAVLFIDLDDFKTVNDGLGHDVGDELLKVMAFRLESFIRPEDTAARLGGDEFSVLLEGMFKVEDVMNVSQRLLAIINQPVEFGSREINVTTSIGIAIASEGISSEELLRNADVAMYHAKKTGKSKVKLFDQAMHVDAFERLELKADLAHALERDELFLHYQPLFSLKTREVVGFEALMRWNHPTRGFVSPGSFIPLAEETGLIVPIGAWAAQQAFKQLAEWRKKFRCDVGMSVNVSPRQLDDNSIVEDIESAIRNSGVDPSWITLEVTESSGVGDEEARGRLIQLRSMGCEIAADDFGTGFATYASLQRLPFTNIKIDRSLISGLGQAGSTAHAQVRSIIQMAHHMGATITAEGIEEARQADVLVKMNADKAQGFLFGKPVSPSDAEEHLRRNAQTD